MSGRLLLLVVLCASGCKAEDKGAKASPETESFELSENETRRGLDACAAYKKKACECAETSDDPERARDCKLADVRIDALKTQMRVLAAPGDMDKRDRSVVFGEVRKVIKGCFEDALELEKTCLAPEPPAPE